MRGLTGYVRGEEGLPRLVARILEGDTYSWIGLGANRNGKQLHTGLTGGPTTFLAIAVQTGANNIFPSCFYLLAIAGPRDPN